MRRPKSGARPEHGIVSFVHPGLTPDLMERAAEAATVLGAELRVMPQPPLPDPRLAALVPVDLTEPPIELMGTSAVKQDARSPLRRLLRELSVDPREVRILHGVGGTGPTAMAISIYAVPGLAADVLADAFERVIFKPRSATWTRRDVDGREIRWIDTPEFSNAFWARDGLVVHVGGDATELERVIPRLP